MKARKETHFCFFEATACFLIFFAWLGRHSLYFTVVTGLPHCSRLYIRRQAEKHAECQWALSPMPASALKQCMRAEALLSILNPREIPAQPASIFMLAGLSFFPLFSKRYLKIRLRFLPFTLSYLLS